MKLFLILIFSINLLSADELTNFYQSYWQELKQNSIKALEKDKIITEAIVISDQDSQTFTFKAAGYHNKKCNIVLRKLSQLEQYHNWIDFITTSTYNEKSRLYTVSADHSLLPFKMIVYIIVDRPTKEGSYPFSFPISIFKDLKGKFVIKEINNRCALYAESFWHGKKTKIPDLVIELFTETLAKLGAHMLIRKSQF